MNVAYTWKLLVVTLHGSMERIKDTTEAFTTWSDQVFLATINIKTNGAVQQKNQMKYTYEISIFNYTTPQLILHVMSRNPAFVNS